MIYHDKTKYFNALQEYLSTPGRIDAFGNGYYLVRGKWIPDKEYFRHNKRPTYEHPLKPNPDGTKIDTGIVPIKYKK